MSAARRLVLPDINIWLAFSIQTHPHHDLVKGEWNTLNDDGLTFCRVTQMGFLRLLTNPKAMGPSVHDAKAAWALHDRLVHQQRVTFTPETENLEPDWRKRTTIANFSHHSWTDAYLAAFAHAGGLSLLTLDAGFKRFDNLQLILWS